MFYYSLALNNIFVQIQSSEQTLFNFLILGKYGFPPKKFYNIDYSPHHSKHSED